MKLKVLNFLAGSVMVMSFATAANATNIFVHGSPCYWQTGPYIDLQWCANTMGQACAPEVVEGNLKAADRVLNALSQTSDFAGADKFKSELTRIQNLSPDQRIGAYFEIAGVNSKSNDEIANFIGARSPQDKNVNAIKSNLGLSDAQAGTIVQSLSQQLAGGLK